MSPETSKRKAYRGNYPLAQVRAMHLAAQYLEIPFRVLAREGEQFLTEGTAKRDLFSNLRTRVPRETKPVPHGYNYVQFDLLRNEGPAFWNRIREMESQNPSA